MLILNRTRRSSSRRRRARGQALVEFALVIPLFLLVLSGILDFGFLLYSRMTVINSTREGARAAVIVSDPATIATVAQGRVTAAGASAGLNLAGRATTSCLVGGTTTTVACSSTKSGDYVNVAVTYPYSTFFPLLFGATINLTSNVQMVLE